MKFVRSVGMLAAVGAVLALAGTALAAGGGPAQFEPVRYEFAPEVQTFTVPAGITEVEVEACGAQGGIGADQSTPPGLGARVETTLAVQPGEILEVRVGGRGGDGAYLDEDSTTPGGAGGFNGGGNGGDSTGGGDLASGGGGGGASDVRQGGSDLANRAIVAAGGGGSGAWTADDDDFPGGPAGTGGYGGLNGLAGGNERGGGGATQALPGTASANFDYDPGLDGVDDTGGAGGAGTSSNSRGGGGAGGGLFGGAGGGSGDLQAGGGGGGGSSLAPGGIVTDGACEGNGYVEIRSGVTVRFTG